MSGFADRRSPPIASDGAARQGSEPSVGRRTLVEQARLAADHGGASEVPPHPAPGTPNVTAPADTSTTAPTLPHYDMIRNAFRRRDLSQATAEGRTRGGDSASGAASRWVSALRSLLDPQARARFDQIAADRSAQEVMELYDGDLSRATRELGSTASTAPPDTAERYTVGELPPWGPARWTYFEDPANWTAERAALQNRLLAKAKAQAALFAEHLAGSPPTLFAMRGNTAAGKTRAVTTNVAELAGPMQATKELPYRSLNPDNFKLDLMRETPGATYHDVHAEAATLADRLEKELLQLRTSDGQPASMLIDKRLLFPSEVKSYAQLAQQTGRRFVLFDVDAGLEDSLIGVLERVAGGPDPLTPFQVVADGFKAVRDNRPEVRALFEAAEFGEYRLYGTTPTGTRVEVLSMINGVTTVKNPEMYQNAVDPPELALGRAKITRETSEHITRNLGADRAVKIRGLLARYEGWTWKSALDAHSREMTPQ